MIWLVGGADTLPSTGGVEGLDKVGHFGMYGVLGWLVGRGWMATGGAAAAAAPAGSHAARVRLFWPILLVVALGAADELRQAARPERSAEFADWAADTAGAAVGFFFAVRMARHRRSRE